MKRSLGMLAAMAALLDHRLQARPSSRGHFPGGARCGACRSGAQGSARGRRCPPQAGPADRARRGEAGRQGARSHSRQRILDPHLQQDRRARTARSMRCGRKPMRAMRWAMSPTCKKLSADKYYGNIVTEVQPTTTLSAPEPLDVVWTSQNFHDYPDEYMGKGDPSQLAKDAFKTPQARRHLHDHRPYGEARAGPRRHRHAASHRPGRRSQDRRSAQASSSPARARCSNNPADPLDIPVFDKSIRGHTSQFAYKFVKPQLSGLELLLRRFAGGGDAREAARQLQRAVEPRIGRRPVAATRHLAVGPELGGALQAVDVAEQRRQGRGSRPRRR